MIRDRSYGDLLGLGSEGFRFGATLGLESLGFGVWDARCRVYVAGFGQSQPGLHRNRTNIYRVNG